MKKETIVNLSFLLITNGFSWFLSYKIFDRNYDAAQLGRLNDNLNQILNVDLQYPYVEDTTFIKRWNEKGTSKSDSTLRYETYCYYVFDFIQNTAEYYNYNKRKIEKFVDVKDFIFTHEKWWKSPSSGDEEAFPKEFRKFVDNYLKESEIEN